jgi:NAD(P)-dependent dehydrogenase (short-subunit alcohol dehydrogenase family)
MHDDPTGVNSAQQALVHTSSPGRGTSPLLPTITDPQVFPDRADRHPTTGAGLRLGRVADPADVAKAVLALMDQDPVTGHRLHLKSRPRDSNP